MDEAIVAVYHPPPNDCFLYSFIPQNCADSWSSNSPILQTMNKWIAKPIEYSFKPVLLWGKPGIGKTTFAYQFLIQNGYDIIEWNASDARTSKVIETAFNNIYFKKNIALTKKTAVILDESDGMLGGDRGGISSFIKIYNSYIKHIQSFPNANNIFVPTIFIANYVTEKKMIDIKNMSLTYEFKEPCEADFIHLYKSVKTKYPFLDIPSNILKLIIQHSQYDYRKFLYIIQEILRDLQTVPPRTSTINESYIINVLSFVEHKDIDIEIEQTVLNVMKSPLKMSEILYQLQKDRYQIPHILLNKFIQLIGSTDVKLSFLEKSKLVVEYYRSFNLSDVYLTMINTFPECTEYSSAYCAGSLNMILHNKSYKPATNPFMPALKKMTIGNGTIQNHAIHTFYNFSKSKKLKISSGLFPIHTNSEFMFFLSTISQYAFKHKKNDLLQSINQEFIGKGESDNVDNLEKIVKTNTHSLKHLFGNSTPSKTAIQKIINAKCLFD